MRNDDAGELLVDAAAEMLRPIVSHLLGANVPFGRLERRLREVFVAIADDEFALEDRPQTDSRVALLTGLNRKEVHRIRSRDLDREAPAKFGRNRAASLIGRWLTSSSATDARGKPQPIPYQAARGPSFVRFAREVAPDLPPRAILDELVRTGAARVGDGRQVELLADSYVPAKGRPEMLRMLAEDPAELVETMLANILSEGDDPLLQRKVSYDNLGSDGVARLRREVRRAGEVFLRRMNRLFARYDRDRNADAPGGDRRSAGIGIYFFEREGPAAKGASASRRADGKRPAKERRR